jgi:hypothetical protein
MIPALALIIGAYVMYRCAMIALVRLVDLTDNPIPRVLAFIASVLLGAVVIIITLISLVDIFKLATNSGPAF